MALPRYDKGIDVDAAIRILRRHNARLNPGEAETFASDIDAMVALSDLDSAWHYTRYVLRQHTLGQLAWPESLRVIASCRLCDRRLDQVEDCQRCHKSGSSQSIVSRWLIEAAPDWKRRTLSGVIGIFTLLGAIAAGIMAIQH